MGQVMAQIDKPVAKAPQGVIWDDLRSMCDEYIDWMADDYNADDHTNWASAIYEMALLTLYGPDVWRFINDVIMRDESVSDE